MEKIFIDATDSQIGRIGSYAAKQSLLGSKVFVVNCEKAIISGNKKQIIKKYKERRARGGTAMKGPFHSKDTEKIVKRTIRGMLPDFRRGRGKDAWRRIKCYNGLPKEYKNEKLIKIKLNIPEKYIALEELKQRL